MEDKKSSHRYSIKFYHMIFSSFEIFFIYIKLKSSVPDPPDPRVFWPPGSESTSQRYGSGSGSGSGLGSFYHYAKIIRKILNPTIL